MKRLRPPTLDEAGILLALLATIFGGWIRLFPPSIAGFPINDGGLFSVMIKAVQADGMRLPAYFQYNGSGIPFAYPPFAFYVGAVLSNLLHLSSIAIVHWLPAIVLSGTTPALYYLAKPILKSSFNAGLAAFAFAFTPRTMTWPIMGGGLTRSFGLLFLLLSLASTYRLFTERDRKYLIPSIVFSTLVVLSHPEAAIHTASFSLLFWASKGRDRQGMLHTLGVALGTFFLTSIWWLPALLRLGFEPFAAAAQTGSQSTLSILYPFLLTLTDEPLLTIAAVLGLLGLIVCVMQKNYFLPVWYFLPYLVDPRSAATYAMIPLTIMAGVALGDVILPAVASIEARARKTTIENPVQSRTALVLLAILGLYMLGGSMVFGTQIAGSIVPEANRDAFSWIRANTPPDSRFLVLTGENETFCDGVQEWFPALTNRISVTTVQGNEWLPNRKYAETVKFQNDIQSCVATASPLGCIEQQKLQYDYLYIARQGMLKNFCRAIAPVARGDSLISELGQNDRYQLAYQSAAVVIFSYLPPPR